MRDLVALTTLPAAWTHLQSVDIAESLADVLLKTLRLDLVYVLLKHIEGDVSFELVCTPKQLIKGEAAQKIRSFFKPVLEQFNSVHTVNHPIETGLLQILVIPIGHHGNHGCIVAGTRSSYPFNELDRLLLSVATNQAVTALRHAKLLADLRAANEAEREARHQAEEANAIKLKFLAMISHELRTPLTSIKGFASTLLADDVNFEPQNQRRFLEIIDHEADRLTDLVEQLLDLSRLQAGTMRIEPEKIPLDTVIDMVTPQLKVFAKAHHLSFDFPQKFPVVVVDKERIVQVISNLIHNAVKYSPPDTQITFAIVEHKQDVQINICDQGIGIPDDEKPHLFEAFRQVERKFNTQKGAGLGLAICKGLIEAHGGKIWIQDQPPPGTTISFTLPTTV